MTPALLARIRQAVNDARQAEAIGHRNKRNEIARDLFKSRASRKVTVDGCTVETWWDWQSQNYITTTRTPLKDESNASGHKNDAAVAHLWALYPLFPVFVATHKLGYDVGVWLPVCYTNPQTVQTEDGRTFKVDASTLLKPI